MNDEMLSCLERIADALERIQRAMLMKESYEFDIISGQEYEDFLSDENENC